MERTETSAMRGWFNRGRRACRVGVGLLLAYLGAAAWAAAGESPVPPGKRPEYPLYAPYFGRPHAFTAGDIERLAWGYDLLYGQLPDKAVVEQVRRLRPGFRFLGHASVATVRASVAERQLRRQILYSPCASLAAPLNAKATAFRLAKPEGVSRIALRASSVAGAESRDSRRCVVWIRVDDELMRVESFDPESGEIEVTRDFDGCNLQPHAQDAPVFCPVYGIAAGGPREGLIGQPLHYHYDPAYPARWTRLFEELCEATDQGADGLWVDLLPDRMFRETDLNGNELKVPSEDQSPGWNFMANRYYSKDEIRKRNEEGLRGVREKFRARTGRDALLVGNHLMAARYEEGAGGYKNYLLPAKGKPAALDGVGLDEFAGGYNLEEWLLWTRSRRVTPPRKAATPSTALFRSWSENVRLLVRCAQNRQCLLPFIINASARMGIFEEVDRRERHEWELWAYASYLLGVEKTEGKCSTLLGVPLFCREGGGRAVWLDPMYSWPIGAPLESRKPEELEGYAMPGSGVYRRRFANGWVLVNPTASAQRVKLERTCYDPESRRNVTELNLEEQTGRILLWKAPR